MPHHIAPGVFVGEHDPGPGPIQGVPTTTVGFAGMTRYGPVPYTFENLQGFEPSSAGPRLITGFSEFERAYGGLEPLIIDGEERIPYLAHGVRAFFLNGGRRCHISRVFIPGADGDRGLLRAV
jgi:phage tail sheath protein FI